MSHGPPTEKKVPLGNLKRCSFMYKRLLSLGLWLPFACLAETPFSGTWVVQPPLTTFSLLPLSLLIDRGIYKRTSCAPILAVPTDGKDHAVAGDPLAESMSVRLLDRSRVEVAEKISGKLAWKGNYAVSKDQKSLTLKYEDYRAANPVSGTIGFAREGDVIVNAHLLSGTWRAEKLIELSATGLTMTIQDTDNGLTVNASDGRSYDIKFDRQDYPLAGYLDGATVQVGRRAPQTLQVNRKQHGAQVEMSLGTVSDDGRTMLLNQIDWQCQSKITWTLRKRTP
jgi:hypothetical protein